jgi:hypothetical protein
MQAYATSERIPPSPDLRVVRPLPNRHVEDPGASAGDPVLDQLLGRLADLIAERVARGMMAAAA